MWNFDAMSLYPSAMWDENSNYPRIETGFADTKDMNSNLIEKFNCGNFDQGSAFLRINNYNPKNLIIQHLPVEERENKF